MTIEDKNWHVLTKTRNGTVSVVQNLTLATAVKVKNSLDLFKDIPPGGGFSRYGQDSDVVHLQIIGPEGWDGCTKAMHHNKVWDEPKIIEGGPNEGKWYKSGTCSICGDYQFELLDMPVPRA